MKFIDKFVLISIFVVSIATLSTTQASPSIECSYYIWQLMNETTYECLLTISNQNGFDNFTIIQGEHQPGFGDQNVTEIPISSGLSTNIPQIICNQFENLKILNLDGIGIEFVDENSFRGCQNVEQLSMNRNEISVLSVDAFWSNQRLRNLDLSYNWIIQLHENVFDNLVDLEVLNLNFNNFEIIPDGTFQNLTNLLDLRLSGVGISSINPVWLESLHKLRYLYLDFNNFTELPEEIFEHLLNLLILNLSSNPFNGNFLPKIFQNLNNLLNLYLDQTGITILNPEWFEHLTNLGILSLKSNNISFLPENILDSHFNLRRLEISNNFLTTANIPSTTFDNLNNLVYLDLSYNSINILNPNWFRNLQNLSTISLTRNRISELPFGIFRPITNLTQLLLGNNILRSISRKDFGNLSSLRSVYVQGNQIIAADKKFFDDARSLSSLNFLNNLCASENFILFHINRENYMQRLSRCLENSRFFVDIQTDFTTNYTFFEALYPGINVQIISSQAAHVTLSNSINPRYEIIIGAQNNTRTIIQDTQGRIFANASTLNILDQNQWRTFQVTWVNDVILVFRGGEKFPFIAHTMDRPFEIVFYGLKSPFSHSGWRVRPINIQ